MKYKICMVGAFAVGKTSLVRQFVHSIFDEKYHTTIGVKIDKKTLQIDSTQFELMIWDIEGVDVFTEIKPSYLRGASGIIYVVDGTRPKTLEAVKNLKLIVAENLTSACEILLLNKVDLQAQWAISPTEIISLGFEDDQAFYTSARTGQAVDGAFCSLTRDMELHRQKVK